jgi:hypothetical protein
MLVRLAYIDRQISICRKHYNDPPEGCPPLGEVQDARRSDCEWCERERAAKLLDRAQRAVDKPVAERTAVERDLARAAFVLDGIPSGNWGEATEAKAQLRDYLPRGITAYEFVEVIYRIDKETRRYKSVVEGAR